MKKKLLIVFILVFSITMIIFGVLKYVIVPKVVVPKIRSYIDASFRGQVKLSFGNISLDLIKGFVLRDVELSVKDSPVLRIKSADIDIILLSLLRKRIDVRKFEMRDANLSIGRDASGAWNFNPIVESGLLKEKDAGGYKFLIKEFIIKDGKFNYFDFLNEGNKFERQFENVDLNLVNKDGELYELYLSGNTLEKSDESINLIMDFDTAEKDISGFVKLNTKYLSEYWEYYLDSMLKPWSLRAENTALGMSFSYKKDTLELEGEYTICKGVIGYGDLSIRGNAIVRQKIKYINPVRGIASNGVKGMPEKDIAVINLSMDDISSSTGEYVFLDSGKCTAFITKKEIVIEELSGIVKKQPVNFSGNFSFAEPIGLSLKGKIADIDNDINLRLLSETQGVLNWAMSVGNSNIKLCADISDLKDMLVNLTVQGVVEIPDLSNLLEIDRNRINGKVNISGNIKGEWDEISSLRGEVNVAVQDFSIWDLQPVALNFNMNFAEGILKGQIPKIDYYKGKLYGNVNMDYNKWGVELNIEKLDIEEFARTQPKFKGMRGILTWKIAFVCDWGNIASLYGGGYIKLVKCDLWKAPIFSDTEKGIESITTDIEMPVVKSIIGNYEIKDENIFIENLFCDAKSMDLNITGKISFSGLVSVTVGAQFMGGGKGLFKIARTILVPVTIGIDLIANCIQVRITGKWPNLEHEAQIQPIGWLTGIFSGLSKADPSKYNLEELWNKNPDPT